MSLDDTVGPGTSAGRGRGGATRPQRLVLRDGTILLSAADGWLERGYVISEGGRIAEVGVGDPRPIEAEHCTIDLDGRRLLPGLVDSHFHLVSRSARMVDEDLVATGMVEGVVNAVTRLAGGVTTVRDCGCRHHGIHRLRAAIDSGLVPGPRALVAGRNPTTSLAPDHWRNVVAEGARGIEATVRDEVSRGADFVKLILAHAEDPADWAKVTSYLDDEELAAAVATAHSLGVRIGVHCEGSAEAHRAVEAGVDVLDHAPLLDDATVELMVARGVVYVPTVWAFSTDSALDDEATRIAAGWHEEHRRSVRRALAAGVTIAAGSDAVGSLPPADVLVDELEALVATGLSPRQAVAAATTGGAEALGLTGRIGVVAAGAAADLVVVDGDPLRDLTVLRRPHLVVAKGRAHDPLRLRADWAEHAERSFASSTSRWSHA